MTVLLNLVSTPKVFRNGFAWTFTPTKNFLPDPGRGVTTTIFFDPDRGRGLTPAKLFNPDPGRGITPANIFDPGPGRGFTPAIFLTQTSAGVNPAGAGVIRG